MKSSASILHSICAAVALIACFPVESGADAKGLPEPDGAFYATSVQDIDIAITWYPEHLGFQLESTGEQRREKGALLARPGALLEMGEFTGATARDADVESHEVYGIFKLGFTTANPDETFRAL